MNKTSLENQKKGNLYVYKLGTGSKTPEYHPPTAAAVTKRIISSSLWGIRRSKPRPKPGTDPGTGLDIDQVDNVVENNRRSVSSMEDAVKGYKGNNNNNSNSNGNNSSSNKIEETRKSVSHVENNVAYVGKFVEKGRKSIGVKLEIENNKNDDNNSKNKSNNNNNNSNINSVELSKVELLQVKVLVTDMPGFMQIHAFQCARNTYDTLEKFSAKHLASNLKKEFDKVYGPAWHCIVGSSFGSFVTHATGCFLYFSMEKLCILLFRTKVQRALKQ